MSWGSFGVGATLIVGALPLWGGHPAAALIVTLVGVVLSIWPALSERTGLDWFRFGPTWLRPPRVRKMASLLKQAAERERQIEKQHTSGATLEELGEWAWFQINIAAFLRLGFDHHIEGEFSSFISAERQKRGDDFSPEGATAVYLDGLVRRLRLSDLDRGFVMPENFSQFDHADWPANERP